MDNYGFHDLTEFQVSAMVYGFLMFWFVVLLRGWQIFVETTILVWLYDFNCLCYFLVMDGYFMDFVIFGDSIALPQCMGFYSLGGL